MIIAYLRNVVYVFVNVQKAREGKEAKNTIIGTANFVTDQSILKSLTVNDWFVSELYPNPIMKRPINCANNSMEASIESWDSVIPNDGTLASQEAYGIYFNLCK